jgi:hypothetical protein
MSSETPGQGAIPGWGQPPAPEDDAPTEPVPLVAPVAPGTAPWGQPPARPAAPPATFPAAPAWGQQPSAPQPQAPTPQASAPAAPAWGQQPSAPQPQAPATAAPAWGQQPSAPPPQAPATAAPQWTQPPAQQPGWGVPPQPAPGQPAWNAAPPQQPMPQPAPQQPAWNAAPPVVPGQPAWSGQQPGWNGAAPPPPKSGNGCLKACLIVAVILVVLAILAVIAFAVFINKAKDSLNIGTNGQLNECPFVSNAALAGPLGAKTQATELTGVWDATVGLVLDKRVLATAQSCWILEAGNTAAGTGRIARYQGGDAADKFATEHQDAVNGDYLAQDLSGVGDQAFCTGVSDTGMTGALVRKGGTLVYVSLFDATYAAGQDSTTGSGGALYSPAACRLAQQVASAVNP